MPKEETLTPINPEALAQARAAALPEEHLLLLVEAFQALADLTRARILYALIQQPLCVRDLAILTGVSESAVSHQLRFLRDRRLVKPHREGNATYYTVDDHHVAALFREADYHVDHVRRGLPDHLYL
jgi:ArsR family transcriptional regulator, lead/cadmium/zinc/bismuth-responsive transcriptional repressor